MNGIFDYAILEEVTKDLSKPIILNEYMTVEGVTPTLENEEYVIRGFITNPQIKSESTRNLHSMDIFRRGDVFKLENGNPYMVIDAVLEKRGAKYKGEARYCNVNFPIYVEEEKIIGRYPTGEPIYEIVTTLVGNNYGIAEFNNYGLQNGAIVTLSNQLNITIRDNKLNRTDYKVNKKLKIEGQSWSVVGIDFTRQGIMTLRAESALN